LKTRKKPRFFQAAKLGKGLSSHGYSEASFVFASDIGENGGGPGVRLRKRGAISRRDRPPVLSRRGPLEIMKNSKKLAFFK
jgi:hypothetical protein